MLKKERLLKIMQQINREGIVTVTTIMAELGVSDMTIRRDLDELEKAGKLMRVHGGAQSIRYSLDHERSHSEKQAVQVKEKEQIARTAARAIEPGDTLYLGPGTTIELLATYIQTENVRIITSSYSVFDVLRERQLSDLILIGGDFRKNTGAFVGPLANQNLQNLNFTKAFVSSNGVHQDQISTYSIEEGQSQKIALNNSREKFLLVDSQKFNKEDFYVFYHLTDFDHVVTDDRITPEQFDHYSQYATLERVAIDENR